jgi:AraC family transcriptional regulator
MDGERSAAEEIGQILDRPPALAATALRESTRLTERWSHSGFREFLPGLNTHVVMTYYGETRNIVLKSDGRRFISKTRPGTITLIPKGHDGNWDISGEIEVSHVYLPEQRLRLGAEMLTGGKSFELLDRVGFDDPSAARILELLGREASNPDPSSTLFVEQALDLLCLQLVRGHSSFQALPDPEPPRGLAQWQVRKVTGYMHEHLAEEIGLDELSGLLGLSRFYFCTAFRLATGKTPHDWLRHQRIEQARKLLSEPYLSVTDVGMAVGYGTPSAFTASFRKLTGVTPTEYRRTR